MSRDSTPTRGTRQRAGAHARFLAGALAGLALAAGTARAEPLLYLEGGGVPLATASPLEPETAALANHDSGRDAAPGLVIRRGGAGAAETDPALYQQWLGPQGLPALAGPVELRFWSAMKGFAAGSRGAVEAFLLDCDATGNGCLVIAGGRRDSLSWNGGYGSWHQHSIQFGEVLHAFAPGRTLSLKVTVPAEAGDDMWFAYDSADHPSRVELAAASDIVIDGGFADWLDGDGAQIDVIDEAGPDDWGSPGRLDVTWFALSSNMVDAFSILMGVDDVPARDAAVATLIDTDLDGNANLVLLASLDGSGVTAELHACDDTLSGGCGNASLLRELPAPFLGEGTAAGPWDADTLLEIALPFDMIGAEVAAFTGMVSYASNSLLISPKDAIFGSPGQAYGDRLVYDGTTGQATIVDTMGSVWLLRRSASPWEVRAADPVATLLAAPHDDLPGAQPEGQITYYVLQREGGAPTEISAHTGAAPGSVRLGFDDLDPDSGPVDAASSSVAASASSAPADGTTAVTITVTPRDALGLMLGAGCAVSVDPWALGPAVLAGPVIDHLNGRYSFRLVSSSPGAADVQVTVEGVPLQDAPSVDFGS